MFHTKYRNYIIFLCAILAIIVIYLTSERSSEYFISDRNFLRNLSSDQIKDMYFGDKQINPGKGLEDIVNALNELEDFKPNHDIGSSYVTLTITTITGQVYKFHVKPYSNWNGAVIESFRGDDDTAYELKGSVRYQINGYMFSKTLPTALERAGITLNK